MLRVGLLTGLGLGTSACSAGQREALLGVDPRDVRLDRGRAVPPRPVPSDREQRRLAVRGGAVAAIAAYEDAADAVPPLRGRHGGQAAVAAAVAVHQAHVSLLGAGTTAGPERFGRVAVDEGGPVLTPSVRPAAALGAGRAVALTAAAAERAADDADVDLALLHARISAARAAQATSLGTAAPVAPGWPTGPAADDVVEALQDLLAQEHRALWSYGVVLAWSSDRVADAEGARLDHGRRVETLTALLERSGASPVGALATYPTDDAGQPVDGPVTAAALALRLEGAVTTATAVVLRAAVAVPPEDAGAGAWVVASVTALAEAERARWSWGGPPLPLPGG